MEKIPEIHAETAEPPSKQAIAKNLKQLEAETDTINGDGN
jgi:hypothetical protein